MIELIDVSLLIPTNPKDGWVAFFRKTPGELVSHVYDQKSFGMVISIDNRVNDNVTTFSYSQLNNSLIQQANVLWMIRPIPNQAFKYDPNSFVDPQHVIKPSWGYDDMSNFVVYSTTIKT